MGCREWGERHWEFIYAFILSIFIVSQCCFRIWSILPNRKRLVNSFEEAGNSVREKITLKCSILKLNSQFLHPTPSHYPLLSLEWGRFQSALVLSYEIHPSANMHSTPAGGKCHGIKWSWKCLPIWICLSANILYTLYLVIFLTN